MGSKSRYSKSRTRKRKYLGKKCDENGASSIEDKASSENGINDGGNTEVNKSASGKKLNISSTESVCLTSIAAECNFIMNSDLFISLLLMVGRCPDCVGPIDITHLISEKMGFAQFFRISCTVCTWCIKLSSSKECSKPQPTSGRKGYEINKRTVLAFRENGQGYSGITTFCSCMSMPPPMAKCTFEDINCQIHNAYVETAQVSMKRAAAQVHSAGPLDSSNVVDAQVSGDGAWQKRGYSSLNGVVTLISAGKCVDTEVLSKKCKECEVWEHQKGTSNYDDWLQTHNCAINHTGSAGSMEVVGMKRMFERSVRLYHLRYTKFIGDGDTKSFNAVCKMNPYPDHVITKLECIGHVQKHVGARLRKLKSDFKGKKLSDGKGIGGGKGRLTEKVMNTLQNHYGMAIRQNLNNIYNNNIYKTDVARVKECDQKSSEPVKKRRKKLRAIRKGFNDRNELDEGETYASGAF